MPRCQGADDMSLTLNQPGKRLMATIEVTKDNFEEIITGNDIVLLYYWAPWCVPCRQFAPVYESLSQ
mgnify:FL=1